MAIQFIGNETQVNTTTAGNQTAAKTAPLANGGYVTVWASDTGDGSGKAIMGQIFDANGNKVGSEFLVNTTTAGDQDLPDVIAYNDSSSPGGVPNSFIVVWQSAETFGNVIRGRRYLEDGTAAIFNPHDQNNQTTSDVVVSGTYGGTKPDLGLYGTGRLAIVWEAPSGDGDGTAIVMAQYRSGLMTPVVVNTTTAGNQINPRIADGDYTGAGIVWESQQPGGDFIRGRILHQGGFATGGDVILNEAAGEDESLPNIAHGGTLVIWNSGTNIVARDLTLENGMSTPTGSSFILNTTPGGVIDRSDIVGFNGGEDYIAVYFTHAGDDGSSYSIRAEHFTRSGGAVSAEILVPQNFAGAQQSPTIVQLANGNFVITWASEADALGNFEIKQRLLTVNAGSGNPLTGTPSDDVLTGTPDHDTFTLNQGGNDSASGLARDDLFIFGATLTSQDSVDGGEGSDQIEIQGNYTGANALTLGAGVVGVESLVALSGNDTSRGDPGTNSYSYHVTTVNQNVAAGTVMTVDASRLRLNESFALLGNAETDGTFHFTGGWGNDYFASGSGADYFFGGIGSDTVDYRGATAGVVVTLNGDGASSASDGDSLNRIENAAGSDYNDTLTGDGYQNFLDGRAGDDTLYGGAQKDHLDGGSGADYMDGGHDDDFYVVDNVGDVIVEISGKDTVATSISYTLGSQLENLQAANIGGTDPLSLTGNGLVNFIWGNQGNNVLNGAGGADYLIGYGGDDFYLVDNSGDTVYESPGGGSDTVATSVNHILAANVENLQAANIGGSDPLSLTGNALGNFIWGTQGNNVIDGAGGADFMIGYAGNDIYHVDNAGDIAYELEGGGADTAVASISYTLAANVENLQALNIAGTAPLALTGNSLSNFIWATQGNNVIDGGAGADFMIGYGGNDVYFVDNAGDVTFEEAGGGEDTVAATSDYALGSNIENLQAANIGGTANLALTGNEQGNFIWGTQGNNVIAGRGGNDRIFGYGGADQFLFNTAAGNANFDWLDDFQAGVDKIVLDNSVFTALADGALPSSAFVTGTAAADADDRIIFNAADGSVFYDADGNGAGAALLIAYIPVGQALTATDFLVV